jgi:hypothetical protein
MGTSQLKQTPDKYIKIIIAVVINATYPNITLFQRLITPLPAREHLTPLLNPDTCCKFLSNQNLVINILASLMLIC